MRSLFGLAVSSLALTILGAGVVARPPHGFAASEAVASRPSVREGVAILAAGPALAPSVPGRLTLATERVVVFKDGHGLFTKTANGIADSEGRVHTEKVPAAAVLGSFWALSDDGKQILGMRAEWDERREEREVKTSALSVLEVLRASTGKSVTVTYTTSEKDQPRETYTGTLSEILEVATPAGKDGVVVMDSSRVTGPVRTTVTDQRVTETVTELVPRGGELAVLETADKGRVVLPVAGIRTVSGKEVGTKVIRHEEVFTRSKRLTFDFGKELAGKPVKLRLFYFTPGIRWIPTYRVGGDLKERADIALQGEILNEEEDIEGAALDLVVGVPNFRFKGSISPLSLETVLRNTLAEAAPQLMGRMGNDFSNAMFSQRSGEFRGNNDEGNDEYDEGAVAETAAAPVLPAELTANAEQDLFVYGVKSFTLKKGGRATVPLWAASAPLRHVYTLDVDVVRSGEYATSYASNASYQPVSASAAGSPLTLLRNKVWHQLEMQNPGNLPWTTGAAFVTSGGLPISQELLTYTSPGGKTLLPLTVATDVRGEYDEEEIERRPNAKKWNNTMFVQIRKKGTVTVRSYRKETSTVRVKVAVGGKAEAAGGHGTIKLDDFRASDWQGGSQVALNNHSEVIWELTLKPGETRELDYTFSFYSR